jgi:hypothetical protein
MSAERLDESRDKRFLLFGIEFPSRTARATLAENAGAAPRSPSEAAASMKCLRKLAGISMSLPNYRRV